jgi:hypothetical protein
MVFAVPHVGKVLASCDSALNDAVVVHEEAGILWISRFPSSAEGARRNGAFGPRSDPIFLFLLLLSLF